MTSEHHRDRWTPETIKHAAVDLPFTSLPAAVAWHLERANRPRPWPGRSLDVAELYEWLRSHPGERFPGSIYVESNALFEWLTREGVMDAVEREWPRADDPQCEESLRLADLRGAERPEDWELINRHLHGIASEAKLREFLLHMRERCPWLAEEWPGVAAQPNRRPKQDGLYPPNHLVLKGKTHELPPTQWRVLDFMWQRETAPLQDLAVEVWGGRDDVKDGTIKATLSKLNTKLLEYGCRVTFNVKSGCIIKTVAD